MTAESIVRALGGRRCGRNWIARCPGEGCPKCGERAFRVAESRPDTGPFRSMGVTVRQMRCEKCGYTEARMSG